MNSLFLCDTLSTLFIHLDWWPFFTNRAEPFLSIAPDHRITQTWTRELCGRNQKNPGQQHHHPREETPPMRRGDVAAYTRSCKLTALVPLQASGSVMPLCVCHWPHGRILTWSSFSVFDRTVRQQVRCPSPGKPPPPKGWRGTWWQWSDSTRSSSKWRPNAMLAGMNMFGARFGFSKRKKWSRRRGVRLDFWWCSEWDASRRQLRISLVLTVFFSILWLWWSNQKKDIRCPAL